jgi:group I intron endonuclease
MWVEPKGITHMIIYKTTNLKNGKIYIGKDMNNDPYYLGSGKLLRQAIKKYGKEAFVKEVLEECTPFNINDREIFWINHYQSKERIIGYNIASGGSGGDTISHHPNKIEIGLRHSEKMKDKPQNKENRKPHSSETREKISKALSGENNPMFGKSHNDVTKEKISLKQKQRNPSTRLASDDTKQKIAKANTGKKISNETKRKISIANTGEKNGFFGKTHSLENIEIFREVGRRPKSEQTKQKLREANLGKYTGKQNKSFVANGVLYTSLGDCHRLTNEPIHIIRGKLKNEIYVYL